MADCPQPAGTYRPLVDHGKCEGKKDCVAACPYDVFEVRRIDAADYAAIGLLSKLKVRAHGMQSAYTPKEADCRACGLCVKACPEKAIKLVRV